MGWFIPSVMTVSMSSAVPTFSASARKASLIIGMRTRLAMKPGRSADTTGVLPRERASSITVWSVSSDVRGPRTTSTSCMIGTGFMKCMPATRSARWVRDARPSIEIDDVFEARITSLRVTPSSLAKTSSLTFGSSNAAIAAWRPRAVPRASPTSFAAILEPRSRWAWMSPTNGNGKMRLSRKMALREQPALADKEKIKNPQAANPPRE